MPLVGAAILPHSPLLLPGLRSEIKTQVQKTTVAIHSLADELYAREPEVLLLMAAHTATTGLSDRYAFIQAPQLPYSFAEFGDLKTQGEFKGAVGFTHRLKERWETVFPFPLVSVKQLPYTFAVPLVVLGEPLNKLPVVCLQVPKEIPVDEIKRLALLLSEELDIARERVVMLAAGDLAHATTETLTESQIFDKLFCSACDQCSVDKLVNLEADLRARTRECLWAPTTLLCATLGECNTHMDVISYESPVGVGFLVARFDLA